MVTVERDGQMVEVPGEWRLPDHRILPEVMREAEQAIEHMLKPAGVAGVKKVFVPLMLSGLRMPATEGMEDKTMATFLAEQGEVYERHLKEIPLDILEKAADECARSSPHFPAVADFWTHARPELEKRQRYGLRIKRLADAQKREAEGKPAFTPEPDEVVWRGDVERFHKFGKGLLHDRLRTRAIESERKLAELEGREPNLEQFGKEPAHIITPAKIGPELTGRSATTLIVDELEEPPQPTADHHANGEPL